MAHRLLAVLFVVSSLMAPSMVGLACSWICAAGSHHLAATAGHDHAGMEMTGLQLSGNHVCNHDVVTVQLFNPTTERLPMPPDSVIAVTASSVLMILSDQLSTVSAESPFDDSAPSIPVRSSVLRI